MKVIIYTSRVKESLTLRQVEARVGHLIDKESKRVEFGQWVGRKLLSEFVKGDEGWLIRAQDKPMFGLYYGPNSADPEGGDYFQFKTTGKPLTEADLWNKAIRQVRDGLNKMDYNPQKLRQIAAIVGIKIAVI